MKFLSILESIGAKFKLGAKAAVQAEIKALPAEEEIAKAVAVVDAPVGDTLLEILQVVGGVEQVATAVGATTGTGEQKLAAALPQVEDVLLASPLLKGKTIPDLAKFNSAVEDFTSAFVDLVNSVDGSVAAPAPVETPTTASGSTAAPTPAIKVPVAV